MDSTTVPSGTVTAYGTNPRRRRPPVSCSLCRQRKIRCNREDPCSNCVRIKNGKCVYQAPQSPRQQRSGRNARQSSQSGSSHPSQPPHESLINFGSSPTETRPTISSGASQTVPNGSTPPTPASQSSAQEVERLRTKIRQLEAQLNRSERSPLEYSVPTPVSDFETVHSHLAGTFQIQNESHSSNQGQTIRRSFFHKRRFFGQSHWISSMSLFRDIVVSIEPHLMEEGSKALVGLQKCKHLGRKIKAQRTPQWPVPITQDLPPKNLCDALLDCYLRTFEKVYRVLHVPSFKRDYEAMWSSEPRLDPIFLVQLKLVLAIGSTTYDDELSLRPSAIHFIHEAQTWISEPETKARLGIPFLQAQILLLVARELLNVDGGMIWVASGTLVRTAVYMGLHRDPVQIPNMSRFASEMHRRLWSTVLEVCLQSSMESGGSPLISTEEFDTQPPGNFDDDAISVEDSFQQPEAQLTSTSIAIALRKTFPIRLAIAKFLNDVTCQSSYEEALRLDARLRVAYKEMRRSIQLYGLAPTEFEILMLDFVVRRYLISVHIPFFGPSFLETTYAFSRNVVVDTAAKIFNSASKPPNSNSDSSLDQSILSHQIDFQRLTRCGSGFFRIAPMHCSFLIAVELRSQVLEEEGLGPVCLRPDLMSVIQEAKTLSLRCIEVGETNIKGYLFMSLVSTQLDALMQGVAREEIPKWMVQAAEDAEEKCLSILEGIAAKGQKGKAPGSVEAVSGTAFPDMGNDWDFMMDDGNFNFADMDLPSWMLGSIPYGIP
ncbi:unnamed protein product [Penicillium salamii]|uniref:Zn(2)-C6 fungal-type domain-containing protein n=1 Tax=Penicillium salamii TaxID=1612424 RepID=A0A9W4K5B0_9EURO|nr:unnamed protein product [Penicillium salamii]CAG8025560.1 unnamed protein product [Penicillium salamii]CAG8057808.1 unnamed protein product [Penicillium salamii]CAG8132184.1 unnamed protein product [Penicillium salamii]CAG8177662.1 unnamed protein product [Penicillium salamii]